MPGTFYAGIYPVNIAVGDFNGDGKLDIVVSNPGSSNNNQQISILHGNGDGTFQSPVSYTVDGPPNSITVGDFNNDGKQDIASLSNHKVLTILTNTGSSFSSQTILLPTYYDKNGYTGTDTTYSITAGDFNGDHRMDLAYVDSCAFCDVPVETYWIMTNTTAGWSFATGPTGTGTYVIHAADLDLDGKSDLVSTYVGCHTPCEGTNVDYSNGNGTFTRVYAYGGGSLNPISYDATVGDFNNDGIMDLGLIVSSGYAGVNFTYQVPGIAIVTGMGGRSGFNNPVYFLYPSGDTNSVEGYAIGSGFFDANGTKDIATNNYQGSVSYWLNTTSIAHDPCPYPTKPGVHVCSPVNNSHTGGNIVKFLASARAGSQPIDRIELWVDGRKLFQVRNDRLNISSRLANGTHGADVIEVDAAGAYIKQHVTFVVP